LVKKVVIALSSVLQIYKINSVNDCYTAIYEKYIMNTGHKLNEV